MYVTRSNYINKKISKDAKGLVNLKIYFSRKNEQGKWGPLEDFSWNSDDYSVGHPTVTSDGKTIFFISDMPGGYGLTDLYKTTLQDGVWGKPENLGPSINSEGMELFPHVSKQNVLFFSSDGNAGLGGLDIYYSLPDKEMYLTSTNMGYPVNTKADDFSVFINDDDTTGFISSNRNGGVGKDDIYAVNFSKPITAKKQLNGIIVDEKTEAPIPFAKVKITDKNEKVISELVANDKGRFTIQLFKDDFFKVYKKKEGFVDKLTELAYTNISDKENKFSLIKLDTLKKPNEEAVVKNEDPIKTNDAKIDAIANGVNENEPKEIKTVQVDEISSTKQEAKDNKEIFSASADRERLLKLYGNTIISGLKYFVQVGAYRKPQNFKNQALTESYSVKQSGVILGDVTLLIVDKQFDTWVEAETYLNKVKSLGQADAFLTALVEGKRLYLKELLVKGIWENKSLQVANN